MISNFQLSIYFSLRYSKKMSDVSITDFAMCLHVSTKRKAPYITMNTQSYLRIDPCIQHSRQYILRAIAIRLRNSLLVIVNQVRKERIYSFPKPHPILSFQPEDHCPTSRQPTLRSARPLPVAPSVFSNFLPPWLAKWSQPSGTT